MFRRNLIKGAMLAGLAGSLSLAGLIAPAFSQEVTLKLHQFLPAPATVPAKILKPWAKAIEERSGGRIKIEHFDAMSLGGKPPELFDQAREGVADIIMTVVGYTPGRFPKSEVFELPFMMRGSVATSKAYWELVENELQNEEFKEVKMLGAWVHGPGLIHSKDPITKLEDLEGMKVRGPTRVINNMLSKLKAVPVGMPLPAIPEALTKGVISGTVIPWEVTPSIKVAELVKNHTEFSGDQALYTATIIAAMNWDSYNKLPDDLKKIIDEESGLKLTVLAADEMLAGDAPGRAIGEKAGNNIIVLDEAEVARWKEAAAPVREEWLADMKTKNIDGEALIKQADELITKYQ